MARKKSPEERLAELEQRKKELEEKAKRERQQIQQRERKRDTRRKVLLGAKLIEHARENERVARYVQRIIDGLEGRDREPFEGWEVPTPSVSEGEGEHS